MNIAEAMQALLDGKVLYVERLGSTLYTKLRDNKLYLHGEEGWFETKGFLIDDKFEVYKGIIPVCKNCEKEINGLIFYMQPNIVETFCSPECATKNSNFDIYEEPKSKNECYFVPEKDFFYKPVNAKCIHHEKGDSNCELTEEPKSEPKFKKGDKVKVLYPYFGEEGRKFWKEDNIHILHEDGIFNDSQNKYIYFIPTVGCLTEDFLEKVEEPKFKVGDRVRHKSMLNFGVFLIKKVKENGAYNLVSENTIDHIYACIEDNLEKVEEEKSDIPPMPWKEISQEEFKKKYPAVEEEWTYPCVVAKKNNQFNLFIAIKDYDTHMQIVLPYSSNDDKAEIVEKSDYKVIATDLRNLYL